MDHGAEHVPLRGGGGHGLRIGARRRGKSRERGWKAKGQSRMWHMGRC
jgi:hypothetical protein